MEDEQRNNLLSLKNLLIVLNNSTSKYRREHWLEVYDSFVVPLSKELPSLELETKLICGLCTLATGNVELYATAFEWFREWEDVGGAHWIVQQECLRHAALGKLCMNIQSIKAEKDKTILTNGIESLLSKECCRVQLQEKMKRLREEITTLSNSLFVAVDMESMIEKYWRKYPLDDFISWSMKWGQCLLMKYLEAKSEGSSTNECRSVGRNEKIGKSYDKKICLINQNKLKINSSAAGNNYDSDQATDRQDCISSRNEVLKENLLSVQTLKEEFHNVERIDDEGFNGGSDEEHDSETSFEQLQYNNLRDVAVIVMSLFDPNIGGIT